MELAEFKKEKIEGRGILFNKTIETLKSLDPLAIHQFGSGVSGYRDEFSDFDLWITFLDERIKEVIGNRDEIFSQVAPILVKTNAPKNAPMGGSYNLVIYDTDHGLYHVDYYLSPKSDNRVRTEAKHLYGDDSLPRGEWTTQGDSVDNDWSTDQIYDEILVMSYILNKAIVRGGWNKDMADYLRELYKDYQESTNQTLPSLPDSDDFVFQNKLYENIAPFANESQQKAVKKLTEYSELVQRLYNK